MRYSPCLGPGRLLRRDDHYHYHDNHNNDNDLKPVGHIHHPGGQD